MSERVARGSLTGRWAPHAGSPNIRGSLTLEQDLPAGTKLWLAGWTRTAACCEEFVSIVATVATGGPRKRGRRRRDAGAEAEPEGKFRDMAAATTETP